MTEYRFLTTWVIDAPIDAVFAAIDDSASWPDWWPGVRCAELLEEGDADGVGRLWRYVWRSRLPYDLAFDTRVVRAERPWLLEGHADGELIGVGRWRLFEGRGTAVVYEWNVRTSPSPRPRSPSIPRDSITSSSTGGAAAARSPPRRSTHSRVPPNE